MKRLILSLLAVCLLWMANAQNPAWGPQSKVVTDSIYSQVLKAHRAYTIYLPKAIAMKRIGNILSSICCTACRG